MIFQLSGNFPEMTNIYTLTLLYKEIIKCKFVSNWTGEKTVRILKFLICDRTDNKGKPEIMWPSVHGQSVLTAFSCRFSSRSSCMTTAVWRRRLRSSCCSANVSVVRWRPIRLVCDSRYFSWTSWSRRCHQTYIQSNGNCKNKTKTVTKT